MYHCAFDELFLSERVSMPMKNCQLLIPILSYALMRALNLDLCLVQNLQKLHKSSLKSQDPRRELSNIIS